MDLLIDYVRRVAPFLLPRLLAFDYLYNEKTQRTIPVAIVRVGQADVAAVPIVETEAHGLFLPDEDKFVPLSEEVLEVLDAASKPVQTVNPHEAPPSYVDVWSMIRPPVSARSVYAEDERTRAKVHREAKDAEFYKLGFSIEDERAPEEAPQVVVIEPLTRVHAIEVGEVGYALTYEGELKLVALLKDAEEGHTLLLEEGGIAYHDVPNERRPLILIRSTATVESLGADESKFFIVVKDSTYWADRLSSCEERPFNIGTVRVSRFVSAPISEPGMKKSIVPPDGVRGYKWVFTGPEFKWADRLPFVSDLQRLTEILNSMGHALSYLDGGEWLFDGEYCQSPADVAEKLAELGIHRNDVVELIKTAQENPGEKVRFVVQKLQEHVADVPSREEAKQELIEAFDSQMRIFLNDYLEGKDHQPALSAVKSIKAAFLEAFARA